MVFFTLLNSIERSINGKAGWEKVRVLIDKEGKKSIKLDMIPVSKDWNGWFMVSERKAREEAAKEPPFSNELEPF